ncbi:alpha/beta hydrolase [Clostridium sp. SHJSY1]|uniref:alpha/beta hydrolase n=1 Tax=Clostridium sp. SHJSY1 TaxID=2942483 RepID=UPI002876F934|nr:alpha/beta hydrolase [Clostridium sp. SHJSY1]MDS0525626.1 alpha/beta hydrolase [Clostridium sp. SHJSY1]
MINETYALWSKEEYSYKTKGEFIPNIFTYIHNDNDVRPAIIIVPGGAYRIVTPLEGEIVAKEFYNKGYNTFVLTYTTNWLITTPLKFQPLKDLSRAVRFIRRKAEEFCINPEKLSLCGFSAGGHLCGSLAVHYNAKELKDDKKFECISNKPNAVILSYPVISSGEYGHKVSFAALLGENPTDKELEYMSLEKQVKKDTPPIFIWHTATDGSVPVENSYLFAKACKEKEVIFEHHVFGNGKHGISLANEEWATGCYGRAYTMEQLFETAEYLIRNNMDLPEPYNKIKEINNDINVRKVIMKVKIQEHIKGAKADEGIAIWPEIANNWLKKIL